MGTKSDYITKINKIPTISFNKEQKEIAKKIIESTDEKDLDAVYGLITQRVKTGFVFDEAPEVNHNCVALVKEDRKLNITGDGLEPVEHKLIIGENYDALKNLCATYIDKSGKGLIDVIYIDPPYNTEASKKEGNDHKEEIEATKFIYRDKFTRDGWLNMMNERLKLAKRLLSNEGVIFISVDDAEQAYLKVLCDEIFNENNFVVSIAVNKASEIASENIIQKHEYMLCYCKNKSCFQVHGIPKYTISRGTVGNEGQTTPVITFPAGLKCYGIEDGIYEETRKVKDSKENITNLDPIIVKNGKLFKDVRMRARWRSSNDMRNFFNNHNLPTKAKINGIIEEIYFDNDKFNPQIKKATYEKISSLILDNNRGGDYLTALGMEKAFDNPKSVKTIKHILKIVTSKTDCIVLDFFAGSGTTGQAVMELNEDDGGKRQFILVTNNENNIGTDITRERLYRVIKGKGSKGESFSWTYTAEKPYLLSNNVTVFKIEHTTLTLKDLEKAEKIREIAKAEFKKLNPNCSLNNDFDVYNELAALNPQKGDK